MERLEVVKMVDIKCDGSDTVEIVFRDHRETMWVNINGVCVLRVQGMDNPIVEG